jgi:hypothetical protein
VTAVRPALLVLLGAWLGMLVASWVVATVNFRTVDRVLGPGVRPEAAERLSPVAPENRRLLLRHMASEINRWMFRWWSLAQIALAAVLLAALWSSGGTPRLAVGAASVLVLAQALVLAPAIVELGRSLDFVPRPLPPDPGHRFGVLHAAYVGSDFAKAALLVAAAWRLARQP